MIEFNFKEFPLFEFFKGETDTALYEDNSDKETHYQFKLSHINPYYLFMNHHEDEDDKAENNIVSKTTKIIKLIIENDMDVLIENEYGGFEKDLKAFFKKITLSKKPLSILNKSYFYFPVTDKNKKVFDLFSDKITEHFDDVDVKANIISKNGELCFNTISIPYYFLRSDEYYQNEGANIQNFIRKIEKEINEYLGGTFFVKIGEKDSSQNVSKYFMSFRKKRKGEVLLFTDQHLEIVNDIVDNILSQRIKIRHKNIKMVSNHENKLCLQGLYFMITENQNKEIFDGSVC